MREEGVWLYLIYDLKNADERAESQISGVIQGAEIDNHGVIEKKSSQEQHQNRLPNKHHQHASPSFKKSA
jgi:hypothetical protein